MNMMNSGVLFKYKDFLPIGPSTPVFSMGEGNTPLIRAKRLESEVGCKELYFKFEGCNPTGSFKDRGMVMAIAKALEAGSKSVMCASTGNTSASAAAYAAHCNLDAIIMVPKGNIALGKLAQAIIYGAKIVTVNGNFDKALEMVLALTSRHPVTLVNSVNPFRLEGQKTAAFEIVDVLGDAPDYLVIPVGNAGNISAYWMGFKEYHRLGRSKTLPKMTGFQAEGAAPLVLGRPVDDPHTVATAIKIGNPASWKKAVAARDESQGSIGTVTDDQILAAQGMMASKAGVFGEPASAAPLAGLLKLAQAGTDFSGKRVVCVVTGNGLKDTDIVLKSPAKFLEVEPDMASIERGLGWA